MAQTAGLLDDALSTPAATTDTRQMNPETGLYEGSMQNKSTATDSTQSTATDAIADIPEYDPNNVTGGLLDQSVTDINTLTASDNPLMQQAGTRGAQAANSRGLLNSSMGVQAGQAAALDTVMPLVQQNAQTRGQVVTQNNDTANKSQLMDQQLANDKSLMDFEFQGKERLLGVEKEWDNLIQSNINATEFWNTSQEGILDILNNKDLTPEQVANHLDLAFGTMDEAGNVTSEGYISAGLRFISSVANLEFPGVTNDVRTNKATQPDGTISDLNAPDGYRYPAGVDDPRTPVDESRENELWVSD